MQLVRRLTFAVVLVAASLPSDGSSQVTVARPVVFVHGLGSSAAEIGVAARAGGQAPFGDVLSEIARRHPLPGACPGSAQPGRPWNGSPCVFRYVEDLAERFEEGEASRGPNDSQSGVRENADKLADDVEQVASLAGGRRAVLVGYSMGGAIIRTYLALHRERAERDVGVVILVDAVTQGSWGYSFIGAVQQRAEGPVRGRVMELMRTMAASASAVNLDRPAATDLRPRSELFRRIAAVPPPRSISYYTFWGDIQVAIGRRLLVYDLPELPLPSLGDLGLLPGEPDPAALPELGGQRFTPTELDAGREALDVPHTTTLRIDADLLGRLLHDCGTPSDGGRRCRRLLGSSFQVQNTHTQIPFAMSRIMAEAPALGGRVSLADAVLAAIRRNEALP